jgi:hypothetical protein
LEGIEPMKEERDFRIALPGLAAGASADGSVLALLANRGGAMCCAVPEGGWADGTARAMKALAVSPFVPRLALMSRGEAMYGYGALSDSSASALCREAGAAAGVSEQSVVPLLQGKGRALTPVAPLAAKAKEALACAQTFDGRAPSGFHVFATPFFSPEGEMHLLGIAAGALAPAENRTAFLACDAGVAQSCLAGLLKPLACDFFSFLAAAGVASPADGIALAATGAARGRRIGSEKDPRFAVLAAGLRLALERLVAETGREAGLTASVRIDGLPTDAEVPAAMRAFFALIARLRAEKDPAAAFPLLLINALAEGAPADSGPMTTTVSAGDATLFEKGRFAPAETLAGAVPEVLSGTRSLRVSLCFGSRSTFLCA